MAYVSYKDIPIYFGNAADQTALPSISSHRGVYCQQLQFNYTPNIAPVRLLGSEPDKENFNLAGPPNASLSFTFYACPNTEFDPTDYTGDVGDDGTTAIIGDDTNGISLSGLYMTSFSYTLSPYAPVLVQCDFAIYKPPTIDTVGGKIAAETASVAGTPAADFSTYGHGAYSTTNGTSILNDLNSIESIQYQFSANRLPIYQIGSFFPNVVELVTAEQSIQVQGDNIQQLVQITGSNPGNITIDVKNSAGTTLFSTPIDGRITAENISVAGGDLARGSLTVTELLK
ncbi:MAG: hypothetical protein ACPGEG_10720 [Salibacteraceae bacterium]